MDKKNLIIGVSWAAIGLLLWNRSHLVHDLKLSITELHKQDGVIKEAQDIVTAAYFQDIVEHFDD